MQWWEKNERGGAFWLNVTIYLVLILPRFLLNIVVFFVIVVFWLRSKNDRNALELFYTRLKNYASLNPNLVSETKLIYENYGAKFCAFVNFYRFGVAICDKVAVWRGKINYDNLEIKNYDLLKSELINAPKGQVLLLSHFGNVEVAHALSRKFKNIKIVIFVYQKNTNDFLSMIDKVSDCKIERVFVDDIDLNKIMELKKIIESGGHIGIMGDRIALKSKRNVAVDFLGESCNFPDGAFIIAGLLGAKMSMLWCERKGKKYAVELEPLSWDLNNRGSVVKLARDKIKSIRPLVQKYAKSLEIHALNNPTQWFSFYDFWNKEDDEV